MRIIEPYLPAFLYNPAISKQMPFYALLVFGFLVGGVLIASLFNDERAAERVAWNFLAIAIIMAVLVEINYRLRASKAQGLLPKR